MSERLKGETFSFGRGLDLSRMDEVTEDEFRAYQAFYNDWEERPDGNPSATFWFGHGVPGPLKRLRVLVDLMPERVAPLAPAGEKRSAPYYPIAFGSMVLYALSGYSEGVRYTLALSKRLGLSKKQLLEGIACVYLWVGPRGMATIAKATEGFEWEPPGQELLLPPGWGPDPAAFASGLDFTKTELSDAEWLSLRSWYLANVGEIPPYVEFLAAHRPDLLKAFRNRLENCLRELPKQVMPYLMIRWNSQRGYADGIREGVLLGKHWGMSKDEVLESLSYLMVFGHEGLNIVQQSVGGILAGWDGR